MFTLSDYFLIDVHQRSNENCKNIGSVVERAPLWTRKIIPNATYDPQLKQPIFILLISRRKFHALNQMIRIWTWISCGSSREVLSPIPQGSPVPNLELPNGNLPATLSLSTIISLITRRNRIRSGCHGHQSLVYRLSRYFFKVWNHQRHSECNLRLPGAWARLRTEEERKEPEKLDLGDQKSQSEVTSVTDTSIDLTRPLLFI